MNRKEFAAILFPKYSSFIASVNMNAKMQEWIRTQDNGKKYNTRDDIYHYLASDLTENSKIDFLEFGVAEGNSLRKFCKFNTNPESRFFGFDTFEGLPEDWDSGWGTIRKGSYTTNGIIPEFPDSRVSIIKGYYQDVLDDFLNSYTPSGKMIIHLDCDLYSSALYVLTKCDVFRKLNPLILMDDFSSPNHMFRAFNDYTKSYIVSYDYVASAGSYYHQVCVKIR